MRRAGPLCEPIHEIRCSQDCAADDQPGRYAEALDADRRVIPVSLSSRIGRICGRFSIIGDGAHDEMEEHRIAALMARLSQ